MESLKTFFRVVVMMVTLAVVAKAWYYYGPSIDELRAMGSRVAELSQEAWADYWQTPGGDSSLAGDPRPAVPAPFAPHHQGGELIPMAVDPLPRLLPPTQDGAVQLAGGAAPAADDDPTAAIREQLTHWGARDQQLSTWGSRGELHRFRCNVPWANSPAYTRQFEAVAATPIAAVEQVAAEIDAWRRGQR